MIDITDEQMARVRELCAEHGVVKLELFGSAATDAFDPDRSDLDLIALFSDRESDRLLTRFLDFADAMEALFGREVDVLTSQTFRNKIFQHSVDATRKVIHERPNVEAAA